MIKLKLATMENTELIVGSTVADTAYMASCVTKQTVVACPVQMDIRELNVTKVDHIGNITLLIQTGNI